MSALPRQNSVVEQDDLNCAYQLAAGGRESDAFRPGVSVGVEVAAQESRYHRLRRAQYARGNLFRPCLVFEVDADRFENAPQFPRVDDDAPTAVPIARVQ